MYKVLVIGNGAREHALAWKLRQSPQVSTLYVAPGNGGTASIARNLPIAATEAEALLAAARDLAIDLVVVGPEAPLAAGIVDRFREEGIPIFGPTRGAARIETSKVFAKGLMLRYGVPCAWGLVFSSYPEARAYLEEQEPPVVVKADGLAAGKGVTVAQSRDEALEALDRLMLQRVFGEAGDKVVIEECLSGREVSFFALVDGATAVPFGVACDYKRALNNDQGANTGGMGGYSPPGFWDLGLSEEVMSTIVEPVVQGLAQEGTPYQGVLYVGLMLTEAGPKVLEFNVRFGDPEAQVILPRLKGDLFDLLWATVHGTLSQASIEWERQACVGVVVASAGYPDHYPVGLPITGLHRLSKTVLVFHAGTKRVESHCWPPQLITAGGRVLTVVALGRNIAEARRRVYANVPHVHFKKRYFRSDIALREVKPRQQPPSSPPEVTEAPPDVLPEEETVAALGPPGGGP